MICLELPFQLFPATILVTLLNSPVSYKAKTLVVYNASQQNSYSYKPCLARFQLSLRAI